MEADMFEQSVIEAPALTARPWTLGVSLAGQAILISAAIVLPMLHPDALRRAMFLVPVTGPPAGPRKAAPQRTEVVRQVAGNRTSHPFTYVEPTDVPRGVKMVQDSLPEFSGPAGVMSDVGVPGAFGSGGDSAIIDGLARVTPPAPPPPAHENVAVKAPPKPAAPVRITVGGNVQTAKLVFAPAPEYPPLAKSARISGSVHLSAVIGTDGRIAGLRVMDGHPLLVRAAMDAVKRWIYQPTLLNGDPVEVVTEVTVTFTLN
jgi:periplasmic protein TonB